MNLDPLAEQRNWLSPYNYVQNNPLSRVDPDGMLDDWYENENGEIVYDENITSQEDLDNADIEGNYIAESFTAKDQNGDIFEFNEDGSVTDSEATVSLIEAAGINTDGLIEVNSTLIDDGKNNVSDAAFMLGAAMVLDDGTGVGVANDPLLPIVAIVAAVAVAVETDATYSFSRKAKDVGESAGAEHTAGARPSTKGKHEKGRARKSRDRGGEKGDTKRRVPRKRPPGWKGSWPPK